MNTTSGSYREQFHIVVVGHVDHGKSTVIGRLLADTGTLPTGKIEQVRNTCERNAKPFEYAFLLDALQNEQNQGITIDSARCFFKSDKRDYIIIDAPGHIEFLKNMVSGAARAEAALLVIDAKEGVQENSRRHGYMLSMLGIQQVVVLINKMDLIAYEQKIFEAIRNEYRGFLRQIHIEPLCFLPVSARFGQNLCAGSVEMPWFDGGNLLSIMDCLEKEPSRDEKPLRFPVQDIYKFTEEGDERRICAGRVESGRAYKGDEVVFLPSGKRALLASIEEFNVPEQKFVSAGRSIGFTLQPELYIKQGEVMVHSDIDQLKPQVSTELHVHIFWMSRKPMIKGWQYKLKITTAEHSVRLKSIYKVLDASELSSTEGKETIELHDVAECVLESLSPIVFDPVQYVAQTGRFVIVDEYDIAGGGIILGAIRDGESFSERYTRERKAYWQYSQLESGMRSKRYQQHSGTIIISCENPNLGREYAMALERALFEREHYVYYLSPCNSRSERNISERQSLSPAERSNSLRNLGDMAYFFCNSGAIFITSLCELDRDEIQLLQTLNSPYRQIVVQIGPSYLPDELVKLHLDTESTVVDAIAKIVGILTAEGIF